jgi:hypothetical protein
MIHPRAAQSPAAARGTLVTPFSTATVAKISQRPKLGLIADALVSAASPPFLHCRADAPCRYPLMI